MRINVVNNHNRVITARLLRPGDGFGYKRGLTWGNGAYPQDWRNHHKLGIEFYDSTNPTARSGEPWDDEEGQFITRYYLDTILIHVIEMPTTGLDMVGHEPVWKLTHQNLRDIMLWVARQL